jgi:hypothetical protein
MLLQFAPSLDMRPLESSGPAVPKRGRIASILGVDGDSDNGKRQGFAYRSGYTPAKGNPDGMLTPLNRAELRDEAARFPKEAPRAHERGDAAHAARLDVAANDLQSRADQRAGE